MQINVSWQEFGAAVGVALVIYYTGITVRYYWNDFFNSKTKPVNTKRKQPEPLMDSQEQQRELFTEKKQSPASSTQAYEPDLNTLIHDLVDELNALLSQSSAEQLSKDDLTVSISRLLNKYPDLYHNGFKQDILNLIRMECEDKCDIHFSADELVKLW